MSDEVREFVALASLDNLVLRVEKDELVFSDFFISRSPNCIRDITITREDGTKSVVKGYPDEDEYEAGFPRCEYYLELELGKDKRFAFDEARRKLIWALDRLRLFKPGLIWGELYGICAPEEYPAVASDDMRSREIGPWPFIYSNTDHTLINRAFVIEQDEVDSIVKFVNDLKNVQTDPFAVALSRFHLSFDRDSLQDRAVDLTVALESMFADEDPEAIAYKIALRAACLIESDAQKRRGLFGFLKKAYSTRSSIVHGRDKDSWLQSRTYIPTQTNLDSLEEVVRKSLLHLLRNAQRGIILKPSDLDGYLFLDHE